jgi:hypothetical protein
LETATTVDLMVSAKPYLSYAMAHNSIPVVDRLEIHNGAAPHTACAVSIELRDADGRVGSPHRQMVDLADGDVTLLKDLDLRLDPAAMLQLDERRPGSLVVRLEHSGETLAETQVPVQLLAAKQWLARPLQLALEMLAAFVMPNDPAIEGLLAEASTILQRETGSPSLQGYQSGPDRVDQIASAVFRAMQSRHIRYSEPPASWGENGQKVRTPSDVLDGHTGTCLDTTVALAAALEQAGIRPLLWVVEGHAFLGYWREPAALDGIVQTDVTDVVNYIDLGALRLVETTMVCASDTPAEFADTHRPPYTNFLTGDLEKVIGVVDVWTARMNGVVPLPARRRSDGGVQVFEYRPAAPEEHRLPTGTARPSDSASKTKTKVVPPRVQQWKNTLLDLSLRNRLINYTERASTELRVPDGHLSLIEDQLHAAKSLTLLPSDHIDQVHLNRGIRTGFDLPEEHLRQLLTSRSQLYCEATASAYATRMRGLAYKARTIVEETGANNLYLSLGTLVWNLDGRDLRSPLILVPVRLTTAARSQTYRIELDESGGSTPNYCLLEKLRQVYGLELPGLENLVEDDHGIDVEAALQSTRRALVEKGLPYRVEDTASLSILQFAKFRLWKDLDDHWEVMLANPLVKHLVDSPNTPFEDPVAPVVDSDLDALDAECPIPADASQLEAVNDAVHGRTFVLEGPPGTGKSQTITNMLTRAIASGKRVLFVAEKRAALDVVFSRLDSVGMRPFCLDLHDKGSKPTVVRAQVKHALDHAVGVDSQGLDAQREELRASRRNLARYAERLHEKNEAGLSYYAARTRLLAMGEDEVALEVPARVLHSGSETLSRLQSALRSLPETADLANPGQRHPWGFSTPVPANDVTVRSLHAAALTLDNALRNLPPGGPVGEAVRAARSAEDFNALVGLLRATGVPLKILDETRNSTWHQAATALGAEISAFVAASHPGLDRATPAALELPLADLHAQAQAAASSGFFGRKKRLRAVLDKLTPALKPDVEIKPKEVVDLTAALLQVQGAVRALAGRATGVPGVEVPETWNPLTKEGKEIVDRQVEWLAWAGRQVDTTDEPGRSDFRRSVRELLRTPPTLQPGTVEALSEVERAVRGLVAVSGEDASSCLDRWLGDAGLVPMWLETATARDLEDPSLLTLRRWAAFLEALQPLRDAEARGAYWALRTGRVHADDAAQAWERGLAATSLVERGRATGLDGFDPQAHDKTVGRFARSSRAVREHMTAEVPRQVLENRPFHSGAARGQVGALQRELAKQRRGMGVRKLLETYGDLITQVMPCVLVSPDSVARFFPVGSQTFDLVVFDEASQIRVAEAVGSMGRARSVVVVGDSKQMPPTSFAETVGDFDDDSVVADALAVEDQESILSETVQAGVAQRWLSWHYRSQDESLIAFSNRHYYDDRLSSFPAPITTETRPVGDGFGVSLVRVDGEFLRSGKGKLLRTNPVEAAAIFEEIERRFQAASPSLAPSIGVVTFNQQQRAHIEGLIRDSNDPRLVEALDGQHGEGLFVKNLENVQGDERDVILFSTAFSVNAKGVLPLNFGPLTRAGGERRLNVAVTRARRQVIIFSSFDPGQLRAEETQSVGIKHLRAYLDMAAQGPAALDQSANRRTIEVADRHRDQIADALRARGLAVETNVGLSDFKIDLTVSSREDPTHPVMAVLLDGEGWARRRTVGDRDGLPVHVLGKMLRWPAVERVWMPGWLAAPEATIDRLVAAAESAAREHSDAQRELAQAERPELHYVDEEVSQSEETAAMPSNVPHLASQAVPETVAPTVPLTDSLPGAATYEPWTFQRYGGRQVLDDLPGPGAVILVRRALEAVVAAEGPVQHERLAKLVASAFDLNRVRNDRIAAILACLPPSSPSAEPGFAWPTHIDPESWTAFRTSADGARPVEQISLRELGNAMVALCEAFAGAEEEELLRETLSLFGGRRLTTAVTQRLKAALDLAQRQGRITEAGGLLRTNR